MASLIDGGPRGDSRGMNRKPTPADGGVSSVEIDKIKHRLHEVEKILMAQELTMKNLGEGDDSAGMKSHAKIDHDWTQKVERKITKLNTAFKVLTNKFADINSVNRMHH